MGETGNSVIVLDGFSMFQEEKSLFFLVGGVVSVSDSLVAEEGLPVPFGVEFVVIPHSVNQIRVSDE
jgi:hypothetical protein